MSLFILCLRNSMVGTTLPAVPSVRSAKSRHSSILGVGTPRCARSECHSRHSLTLFFLYTVEGSVLYIFPFFLCTLRVPVFLFNRCQIFRCCHDRKFGHCKIISVTSDDYVRVFRQSRKILQCIFKVNKL